RTLEAVVARLRQVDVRHQAVAEALAAHGLFRRAALADPVLHRLRRAAIVDTPVRTLVRSAQVAEIADARALLVLLRDRIRARQVQHLEGEARRRRAQVRLHIDRACTHLRQRGVLQARREPALLAEGEQRTDLNTRGPRVDGLLHGLRGARTARHPERLAQRLHL